MNKASVKINGDVYEALSPILHLSRFTCLLPLKFQKLNFHRVVTKSKTYVICSLLTVIFIVFCGIYGLYEAFYIDVTYSLALNSGVRRYIKYVDVTVVFTTFTTAVATTAYKIDKYIQYFHCLYECDQLLQKKPPKTYKYMFFILAVVVVVSSILISDLVTWINLGSQNQSVCTRLSYFLPYYVAYFTIFVIALVYWQLVHSVKIRLSVLNDRFHEIQTGRSRVSNLKEKEICRLIQAYENLALCTKIVNSGYGFVILLIFLGCMMHLLVTPYTLRELVLTDAEIWPIMEQYFWISIHVARLMLIIEPCHGCFEELKDMSAVACKLLRSNSDDTKNLLQFFVSYLSLCKIEFSAFGLVKIDRSLLPMIVGAITTYLVVLFQFN